MKAFLTALVCFCITVVICHFYMAGRVAANNPAFSMWADETKSMSKAGLTENLNEASMMVFGSSEFMHGKDTPYHPANLFDGCRFNPMLVGAGYYQSLGHAITLAAVEPSMKQRKAVLILSPQWFRKTGVVDQAFASRFSEVLYAAMLENPSISDETRSYIAERTDLLLGVDETTREHVALHNQVLKEKDANFLQKGQETIWNMFLDEKDRFQMAVLENANGIKKGDGIPNEEIEPDWTALLEQAQVDGELENTNQFYIDNDAYTRLEPHLDEKKDMNTDAIKGYQTGPEFDDLRCFLQVCQELEIEPMLVLVPVNGYYYDFTGFPKEARQAYYEKIRGIAAEYNATVADFAEQEYTKYFFEDRVHLGKKGWVMVCESLYDFYKS